MAWHGMAWHGVVFHGIVWFWRHWSTVVILRDWCDNGCDTDITDTLQCKELQWDNKTTYPFLDALFRYMYILPYCQQLSGESHARFGGCLQKRGEYRSVCGEEPRLVETNSTTSTTSCCSHEAAGRKGEEGRKGWEHTFTCSSCSQVQFWKTLKRI